MKKLISVITAIVLMLSVYLYFFRPIRKADCIEKIQGSDKEFILVRFVQTTASSWQIIGDNTGMYEIPIDLSPEGDYPKELSTNLMYTNNIFVFYGEYSEDKVTPAGYNNKVFNVNDWNVIYPINHNSILSPLLSKGYLYSFETEDI